MGPERFLKMLPFLHLEMRVVAAAVIGVLIGRETVVDFGPAGSPVTRLDFQSFGLVDLWSGG